jgi:hypothetical protein
MASLTLFYLVVGHCTPSFPPTLLLLSLSKNTAKLLPLQYLTVRDTQYNPKRVNLFISLCFPSVDFSLPSFEFSFKKYWPSHRRKEAGITAERDQQQRKQWKCEIPKSFTTYNPSFVLDCLWVSQCLSMSFKVLSWRFSFLDFLPFLSLEHQTDIALNDSVIICVPSTDTLTYNRVCIQCSWFPSFLVSFSSVTEQRDVGGFYSTLFSIRLSPSLFDEMFCSMRERERLPLFVILDSCKW